jgi:hypothetical protein
MDRELMTGWLQRDALIGAARQSAELLTAATTVPTPRAGVGARDGHTREGRPHLRAVGGTEG